MKRKILFAFLLPLSFKIFAQTKGHIDKETKEFYLRADIKKEHKFFGYSMPTKKSTRLICFSVFTNDVKDNPFKCLLGAYYESNNILNGDKIIYSATTGQFITMKNGNLHCDTLF